MDGWMGRRLLLARTRSTERRPLGIAQGTHENASTLCMWAIELAYLVALQPFIRWTVPVWQRAQCTFLAQLVHLGASFPCALIPIQQGIIDFFYLLHLISQLTDFRPRRSG